jgi:hypothetical protein
MLPVITETRKTASMSHVDKQYNLTVNADGVATDCDCPDCFYRQHACKHTAFHNLARFFRNLALSTSGVNRIRNRKIETVCWYELSEAEQRAANDAMYDYHRVA